jgi:hypothetical protein
LVTLESVYAFGMSPSELSEQVLARAASIPDGAVARLYLDGVDPAAYRMLDLQAVRDAARGALHLKLEPQFSVATVHSELPRMETLGGQWDGYLGDQDLSGLDRERIRRLGHDYIEAAVEAAG